MQEPQDWTLGQEDPLKEEMATHSSILAWEIPWIEKPGGLQSTESDTAEYRLYPPKIFSITILIIGRTNVETPILWPPDAKNWLIGKYPDAGKD